MTIFLELPSVKIRKSRKGDMISELFPGELLERGSLILFAKMENARTKFTAQAGIETMTGLSEGKGPGCTDTSFPEYRKSQMSE